MSDLKLYVSSGIFVAVTVLKLLFPSQTEDVRAEVVALIDMDMNYRGLVEEVGAVLTDKSIGEVMGRFIVTESPKSSEVPLPTAECVTPSPLISDGVEMPSPDVLSAMEAFFSAQEAYADHAVPANVSYESLTIPFSYAAPVSGVCSSGFGYRVHPLENAVLFHYGTDYEVNEGTPIGAFGDGTVSLVGTEDGYGNYLEITHEDGWKTLYAHCSSVLVSVGQQVTVGECIAYSGHTGRVTGPHLHLELTHNDLYTNPEFFLT